MKHSIDFYEDEHIYLVDGIEYPSVTSILSYMDDGYDKINPMVLAQASRRGTLVHEYTELIDYGAEPEEVEYDVIGYLEAYKKFLRDYKPDWDLVEAKVFSEMFGFVGTLDRSGVIDGRNVIVDIKTLQSPTKVNKLTVCSQTSAYAIAKVETYGIPTVKRYALYLGKDGRYNLMDCEEYEAKYEFDPQAMFLRCLKVNQEIERIKAIKDLKAKRRKK